MLWLHSYRPRPGWYELEAAERAGLEAAWRGAAAAVEGAEFLGEYSVRGQSTQERVQVWRFADADRLEAFWSALLDRGYADWRVSENVVGVPEIPFSGGSD
jgi:hypothetical protein